MPFALARRHDRAAVQLDKTADEGQTDSEAALSAVECPIGLDVQVEDEGQQPGRDAEPRILDGEHGVAALGADCHPNVAAWRRVLDPVGQQRWTLCTQPPKRSEPRSNT